MRLKLLMVPFAVLLSLILAIGFIKPDLTTLKEKQALLATKTSQSQNMTTLLANIAALSNDLNDHAEAERFMMGYLPQTMDQEKVIDKFNFLASQSGVLMVTATFREIEKKELETVDPIEQAAVDNPLLITGTDESGALLAPVAEPLQTKTFSAQVTVKGGYENIKDFFNRVAHMDRYHKVRNFSLVVSKSTGSDGEGDPPGTLLGVFLGDFDYLSPRQVKSALNEPVFTRSALDISRLNTVLGWVTNTVPPLQNPQTGRPNPFQ